MKRERGTGRVFQRGSVYWIAYYAPGDDGQSKEHREPGGKTEPEARKLLRHRLDAHRAGLRTFQGPQHERITLAELLDGLERDHQIHGRKGLPQLKAHLRHVRAFFQGYRAIAVTAARLREYISHRQGEGAANATINRELEGIQRAFALAVESGTLAVAPKVPSLSEHNARQGFFERGDFEAVVAHLQDADLRDFVTWFYWTGMRPGEIRSLTWAAFDEETWTLRLHASEAKTGHGRVVALEGELRAIVERRIKARRLGCPFIFHRQGRPIGDYRKAWKTACKTVGIEGRIPYHLRRTAVRNMVRAGVDPAVAMKISGHRTRAVFDRYNIVSEQDLREAVKRTEAYLTGLPTERKVLPLPKVQGRA